jgi:RimJ/RimL family protein N-acetyltransferase
MLAEPVLQTERLRLRPPELTDAPVIQALAGDRRIAETTLNIPHPYSEDAALMWIMGSRQRLQDGSDYTFAIIRHSDQQFIGAVGIHPGHNRQAEIGYWVGVPYWGQGYATEAARCVVQFGFEVLGLNRIYATYFAHNPASRRVMEKSGMTFEGILRQHVIKWDQPVDLGCCGILRAEYEARLV